MHQKTVVFYIAWLTRGGAERVMVNLANAFCRRGYRTYLVTIEPDDVTYTFEPGVERVLLDAPTGSRIRNLYGRILQLRAFIRKVDADVLVSFIGKANIRAVLAALGTKTRVFVSVRSAPTRECGTGLKGFLYKTVFRFADGAALQSEDAVAYFSKSVQKKARILYNPLSKICEMPYYDCEAEGQRRDEIVTVGRMDPVKNHLLLLEAFAKLAKRQSSCKLVYYGGGDCMEMLKKRANELSLCGILGKEDRVVFKGDVADAALQIRGSRLFVLSSDFEGMPNAIAEAMAMSIPVVSTDCPSGGAKALVGENEQRGLLVPVKDVDAMAGAMERVLSDAELAEKLSRAGYDFSVKMLRGEVVYDAWEAYLFPEKQ